MHSVHNHWVTGLLGSIIANLLGGVNRYFVFLCDKGAKFANASRWSERPGQAVLRWQPHPVAAARFGRLGSGLFAWEITVGQMRPERCS